MRAVTRSGTADVPEGVEQVAADVATPDGARRACAGAAVVYHCAQPDYTKWVDVVPAADRAVLDGTAEAGAKLVFADNLYVYGPPDGPMTEETPQRAQGSKGRIRVEMAAAILRAHADGRLRCTIGRSSDYYGPRGTGTTAGDNLMKPALRGKRARWLGSLDQPHTLNYLEDMGRALVTLGERDEADGQVWHLPAAEPLTGRQFLTLVYEAAGHPAEARRRPRTMIRLVGRVQPARAGAERDALPVRAPVRLGCFEVPGARSDRSSRPRIATPCGAPWSGSEAGNCDTATMRFPILGGPATSGGRRGRCRFVPPVSTSNSTSVAAPFVATRICPPSSLAGVTAPGVDQPGGILDVVHTLFECREDGDARSAAATPSTRRTARRPTSRERVRPAERRAGWPTTATARLGVDALAEPVTTPRSRPTSAWARSGSTTATHAMP